MESSIIVKREHNTHHVYRITPHKSVLNSQNRRLWAVLHELISLYSPLFSRTTRHGVKVSVRAKDDIWWIVRMTYPLTQPEAATPATPDIQFYIATTDTFDDTFRLRLSNHEQWKHVTLTESEMVDVQIPVENTKVSELRLARDNMFSLVCNYSEQTSPIRNMLDVVHQLKEGDTVSLFMRMECVPRLKWKRMSQYSWSIWNRGKVPQRNRIKPEQAVKSASQVITGIVNEAIDVTEDIIHGIEKSFFASKEQRSDVKLDRIDIPDIERQQLLVNGKLSKETDNKQNNPVFKTMIRVLVHCDDNVRRDMIMQSVCGAFVELNGDNQIVTALCKQSAIAECNTLTYSTVDRDPVLLSNEEIGKLAQLPTSDLQDEYKVELKSNRAIEVELPSVFANDKGIYMGTIERKGTVQKVYIPTSKKDILFRPRVFIGSPGAGKDMAIVNFIVEAKRQHNIGAVILDVIDERGDKGMSDSIRDALSPSDVIDLNLGDFDYPIYLGLQNITQSSNQRIINNRIAQELTSFLMGDDAKEQRTEDYLMACAQAAKADPVLIRAILQNENVRQHVIETTSNEDVRDMLVQFDKMKGMQNQIAAPVLTRIGKIMRDEFLKPLFGQRYNPDVTWGKWIGDNKVVIVRIPSRDLGPVAMKTVMHWLTLVIFLTKIGGCGGETYVILNEPHQYESSGWISFVERMMFEGRKLRIAPIFAFHEFNKLSNGFINALMGSGVNWHIGNNSSIDVFRTLKHVLQPTFTPEEAMEQVKLYHFIAVWYDTEGAYQTPFIYHAPDLVHKRYETHDNSKLTLQHSKRYGRPVEDVLRDIRTRYKVEVK